MPTAYSRVTVVNGSRRVDLALPSALPLADVIPQMLRYCAADARPERPDGWTVSRLAGPRIGLDSTLDDAGVVDGDVLELVPGTAASGPVYVEDIRDAVEDEVDRSGRLWTTRTSVAFALVVAAALVVGALAWPPLRTPKQPATLITAMLVLGALALVTWFADRAGHALPARLLAVACCLWGGMAGWALASFAPGMPPMAASPTEAAAGLAGVLLAAILMVLVTRLATLHLAAAIVLALAGAGIGITALAGADPLQAVRAAVALGALVIGVLARVSLTVGGLSSADYRVRRAGRLTRDQLATVVRRSTALLTGALTGLALFTVAAGIWLAESGTLTDRLLAFAVAAALLLRSRLFSQIQHAVLPRLAGIGLVVAQVVGLAREYRALAPWLALLVVVAACGLIALVAIPLSDITKARVKQVFGWAEVLVVVGLVVVTAAALGAFAAVAGTAHVSM